MNIIEMHNTFRTFGQAMGLQLVRGILPESIDVYLNAAIIEKCRSILYNTVGNSIKIGVLPQSTPISPINSLRTLYNTKEINASFENVTDPFQLDINLDNVMIYTNFYIKYENSDKYVHCRFIEPDKLAETLIDYCTTATKNEPIITLSNQNEKFIANIFTGKNTEKITNIKINYIKNPAIVKYDVSGSNNINCDLPEYLHDEIVELAVKKYNISIGQNIQQ